MPLLAKIFLTNFLLLAAAILTLTAVDYTTGLFRFLEKKAVPFLAATLIGIIIYAIWTVKL